jgi:Protein of unknown function (DUF4238)
MTKLRRRNHYLAECYQQGFTDADGHLWVKFSGKPEPESRTPHGVGWEKRLYLRQRDGKETDEIETYLANEVDSRFAPLAQRFKSEREKFSVISGNELGSLIRFVVAQIVRTLAHKSTINEQAGMTIPHETFLSVTLRKLYALTKHFHENHPQFHFYTSLPFVGGCFISGDNPVVIIEVNANEVWTPVDEPRSQIRDLGKILENENRELWMPLTPYLCVCIKGRWAGGVILPPATMEPFGVRRINRLVAGQSKIFTLARDRESLT